MVQPWTDIDESPCITTAVQYWVYDPSQLRSAPTTFRTVSVDDFSPKQYSSNIVE
jgi:hypothetical protein